MAQRTEDLLIIGAGGTSREIAWAVEEINEAAPRWNLLGFLDDDPSRTAETIHGYSVLGASDRISLYPSARIIIGVASYANPGARERIVQRLDIASERFATIIAPSARVSRRAKVGIGSAVLQCAVVSPGCVIGNHAIITQSCVLGHDSFLSDYVTLAANVTICGSAHLGDHVYAGAGSIIRDGVKIGPNTVVGMGAVVVSGIAACDRVAGNPARSLTRRSSAG